MQTLKNDPQNVTARVDLVQTYINSGKYAQAESLADEGVRLLPNDARLWSVRGAAYYNDGFAKRGTGKAGVEELKTAADSYDRALKLDPSGTPPNIAAASFAQYGLLLWLDQQYRDCITYAAKAISVNPQAWQYSMLKGDCESGARDYKAALGDYQIAEHGDDGGQSRLRTRLLAAMGNAQLQTGNEAGGLQSLNKAEQLDARAPYPYQTLASYYISKNPPNLKAAMDPLLRLAQLQPDDARVQITIGEIYLRQGSFDQSSAAFTKALQIDPHSSDAQFGLAEIAAAQGDIKSTDSALQKAISVNPSSASFYNQTIAQVLLAPPIGRLTSHLYNGRPDLVTSSSVASNYLLPASDRPVYAQKYADAATQAEPTDGTAWYVLGIAYAQQGKKDLAGSALRKASGIFSSKSCVDVHVAGSAGEHACLAYQAMMLQQTNTASTQLNSQGGIPLPPLPGPSMRLGL